MKSSRLDLVCSISDNALGSPKTSLSLETSLKHFGLLGWVLSVHFEKKKVFVSRLADFIKTGFYSSAWNRVSWISGDDG